MTDAFAPAYRPIPSQFPPLGLFDTVATAADLAAVMGIPGLSPWALGPAYIIHDWIFLVHRCNLPAPPEVKAITFPQSAQILAEVGKALVDANLISDDRLEEIVWAVRTKIR